MSSNVDLPNISENNKNILVDIQNLQRMENNILQSLETNTKLTPDQISKMVENMNQLSATRVNLYTTLSNMNSFYNNALDSSTGTLKQQKEAINIVESELNRTKKRLEYLQMEKNNKIRLVEINEYYGDKYSEHTNLMKVIIFTLIPIIIITFVYNQGLIPRTLYFFLFIIIGVIGSYYFWTTYASLLTRDNMNYDEYSWPFDINTAPKGTSGNENDPWGKFGNIGTCIGQACCSDGQIYNEDRNICITGIKKTDSEPVGKKVSFINDVLTKTQSGKYKVDVDLREYLEPYNAN